MDPIILNDQMYDRGRGPELRRLRITVYDLIPYLLDANYRDELMFQAWPSITNEELQALKKYFAENRKAMMAKHWEIESRMLREWAAQCTPENLARWHESRIRFDAFRKWIDERKQEGTLPPPSERMSEFRMYWEAQQMESVGVGV